MKETGRFINVIVPYETLYSLRDSLGLADEELQALAARADLFKGRGREFAEFFYGFFSAMPETRMVIDHESTPETMKGVWATWFDLAFRGRVDDDFLRYLWHVGVRHVEVNLDQRYTNLGFTKIRQFCQDLLEAELEAGEAAALFRTVDKLLDFYLLIETTAYVETHSRCDLEIMKGIADRVRNPVTVIGGNVNRLLRRTSKDSPAYESYRTILDENARLEGLIADIRSYVEMFHKTAETRRLSLGRILDDVVRRLGAVSTADVRVDIRPEADHVLGDGSLVADMFYNILMNGVEAAGKETPSLDITASVPPGLPGDVHIEITNVGFRPREEEVEKMFFPFYSTKPGATGFGLAIAMLAVRKSRGRLSARLTPAGMTFDIALPAAQAAGRHGTGE
ncbi:MAG: protoglobin domain-containing protein [Nitrospirota bacterium]|jgi:signal transduction histidine kinase